MLRPPGHFVPLLTAGLAVLSPGAVFGRLVYHEEHKAWSDASRTCHNAGGELVSVHNVESALDAYQMCVTDRCWIGYSDFESENEWKWSDGSPADFSLPPWAEGEPSNTNDEEDCGYVYGVYYEDKSKLAKWGDKPCWTEMAFMCDIPDVQPTFEWTYSEWGDCTSTCGFGVQTRSVTCRQVGTGVEFDSLKCSSWSKPESITGCYLKDCAISKFTFYEGALSWEAAEANCVRHGGHLAAAHSAEDSSKIFNLCAAERCWLGYNDRTYESSWSWSDSSSVVDYSPLWAPGEPSNTGAGDGEDCAYVHGLFYSAPVKLAAWGDHPCDEKMAYVCQSSYKFFAGPLPWLDAESVCVSAGGHLAAAGSSADAEAVLGSCAAERCWLGLSDRNEEGMWVDVDGSLPAFTKWAPGEPNDNGGSEDCGYVHGSSYHDAALRGTWGDHPCSEAQAFVCRLDDAHLSSHVMACTFSSGGVSFDLAGLAASTYTVRDVRSSGGESDYVYSFAVCSNTAGVLGPCKDTTGSDNEPKVHMTAAAPAYQLSGDGKSCWRLGDDVHRVGNMEWALLDPVNPAAGVTLTYKNGNVCKDDVFDSRQCVAEYNGGNYCHRQLKLVFACADDTANIPDEERVLESTGCEFIIKLSSAHGCPTACPLVNNRLCNGHGVCGYDRDAGAARCYCNHGFAGVDCQPVPPDVAPPPPNPRPSPPPTPPAPSASDYFWVAGAWSGCPAACDAGVETRVVACQDGQGRAADAAKCLATPASKPELTRTCVVAACHSGADGGGGGGGGSSLNHRTFSWTASPWSACSAAASAPARCMGLQTRTVACKDGAGATANGECPAWATKPDSVQECELASCASTDAGGAGGGWSHGFVSALLVALVAGAALLGFVVYRGVAFEKQRAYASANLIDDANDMARL